MRDIVSDIRDRLLQADYQNEEHVRLSLVCRLLLELGWNIWDPKEVNTEFPAIPAEDKSRVDVALFASEFSPSAFIEVKAVGKIVPSLAEVERQVRDYNRNNTALFSVITDGASWRFYYSQTGGEFHQKCFKACNFLEDDVEDLVRTFSLFLGKENIGSGRAEEEAGRYLQLTNKQKAVTDCLAQARRLVQSPPYPSLPSAVVKLAGQKGLLLSESEAAQLLERMPESVPPVPPPEKSPTQSVGDQKFLHELPSELRGLGGAMLTEVRKRFPGHLKYYSESQRYVETPDNFWTVKIQPRDRSLRITVRGKPEFFRTDCQIQLRPDRAGYSTFKISQTDQIDGAILILEQARRKS